MADPLNTWLKPNVFAGLLGCLSVGTPLADAANLPNPGPRFTSTTWETDRTERQTVISGFFLDDAFANIGVLSVDAGGTRRLKLFSYQHANWKLATELTLDPRTRFVDIDRANPQDFLLTYRDGSLFRLSPATQTETKLAELPSHFRPPRPNAIPHVDITHDLNGDQRPDLVIPDQNGFWLLTQTEDAGYAAPFKIHCSSDLTGIYGADGYRYNPWAESRVYATDTDRDGRPDLVYWSDSALQIHRQQRNGQFASKAESHPLDIRIDSNSPYFLATGKRYGTVLHSIADINQDRIPDLTLYSLTGRTTRQKRSTYSFHYGEISPEGTLKFSDQPDRSFRTSGKIQIDLKRRDLDGDGDQDLVFTTIDRGALRSSLWKSLKGFMGEDISLDLELYLQADGQYPQQPNMTRRIALDGPPSHREPGSVPLDLLLRGPTHAERRTERQWPKAFNSTLLLGDVNGDGRPDMLTSSHPRSLTIFPGQAGPTPFASQPHEIRHPMPNDGEFVFLTDLNRDGKQDIVFHQPFPTRDLHGAPRLARGEEPQQITVMLSD